MSDNLVKPHSCFIQVALKSANAESITNYKVSNNLNLLDINLEEATANDSVKYFSSYDEAYKWYSDYSISRIINASIKAKCEEDVDNPKVFQSLSIF